MFKPKFLTGTALAACVIATSACSVQAEDYNKEDIEKIVHEYIMEHPEIIADAIYLLQERAELEKAEKESAALSDMKDMLFNNAIDPVGGNPEGTVTLIEFFDYNCGYCKRSNPVLQSLIANNPNLKVVYKEWPILTETSDIAARIALAVNLAAPDKYEALHQALLSVNSLKTADDVWKVVKKVGIDREAVEAKMDHPEVKQHLQQTSTLAQQLGITGTPAFIVGDQILKGAYPIEQIQAAIDSQS